MKIIITAALITISTTSYSQTLGDLFKKKKQVTESNNDLIVYHDISAKNGDLQGNGMKYFISDILPTNDTATIKEVMKNRQYSFNKLLGDPISDDNNYNESYSLLLLVVLKKCNTNTLKFFLDNGTNPNLRAVHRVPNPHTGVIEGVYYSRYPLEDACLKKDTAKMSLLIKYGANVNLCAERLKQIASDNTDLGFSEYIRTITGGSYAKDVLLKIIQDAFQREKLTPALIADLVAKGADINATDGRKNYLGQDLSKPLLMYAIEKKLSVDCIREILKQGADVNKGMAKSSYDQPHYPITFAAKQNNLPLMKLLVESGANFNVKGGDSKVGGLASPLEIARTYGYKEITAYLYSKGAN